MELGKEYSDYIKTLPISEIDKGALLLAHALLHDQTLDSDTTIQALRREENAGYAYNAEVDSLEREHPHD